jgi:hypothetical protein
MVNNSLVNTHAAQVHPPSVARPGFAGLTLTANIVGSAPETVYPDNAE